MRWYREKGKNVGRDGISACRHARVAVPSRVCWNWPFDFWLLRAGMVFHRDDNSKQDDDLDAPMNLLHSDDERNQPVERRTHKKSSSGFSLWSRKSFRRSNTAHATSPVSPQVDVTSLRSDPSANDHQRSSHNGFQRQLSLQGSLLEDARRAMAFASEEPSTWNAIPVATVHVSYHIHNPLGPRWYKNHHLIPPSQTKPGMRPPTFFSPSFPPISTSSTPDHHIDSEGSTRTHSHSPLPTPASSQTRVGEGGVKPRSRKTSQTAPDNVDLLDVTDPWGTNWHHESPYDVGQTSGAPDGDGLGKRLRRASMTAAQNSMANSIIPSPLSQSTSAVHLHASEQPSYPPPSSIPHTIHLPRKLNKRKPTLDGLFRPPTRDEDRKAVSAPPTPMERIHLADSPPPDQASLPKRMSVAPPLNPNYTFTPVTSQPTPKKEKRTSVLNRIAKKFSLLTKSSTDESDHREYSWLHVNQDDARISMRQSSQPQPNYPPSEVKRVPPPALETIQTPKKGAPSTHSRRRRSSVSVEAPFLVGNLTVANPDSPESGREAHEPLPIANPIPIHFEDASAVLSNGATEHSGPSRSPSPTAFGHQTWAAYEKPLPVPAPSTAANTPFLNGKSLSSSSSDASSKDGEEDKDKGNLLRSGTLSSNTTKETVKAPRVDPPSVLTIDEETTQSAVSHKAVVDKSVVGDPSDSPDAHKSEKDKAAGELPTPSPSLPPIPITTPFLDTISLRHTTSRASGLSRAKTPNPPPKLEPPQLPPLTLRDSKAATANVYLTPIALSPEEITAQDRINSYLYADSPYTATSVLANPPTPYTRPASIPLTPEPELPPLPPAKPPKEKRSSDEASPSHTISTRQTETFKLVRSLSGNAIASTETIPAAGEQWEVVGSSSEQKPKPRTPTSTSKRESKRESRGEGSGSSRQQTKVEDEGERRRSRSNRQSKQVSQSHEVSTIPMPKLSGSSRHSPPRYEDEGRRHDDQQRESSRYYEDHRRHTKYRSDDDYRRSDDVRRREERARLEEERRIEEHKRYEEERRDKDRERRRRERGREREKERAREPEREERKERERVEREREKGERRERERLEREKEVEQYERMETERLLMIEREKLERERQEREKEREALERDRLALELERERLKREKERDRERRREDERYAREQEKERERKLRLEEERRALEKEQKRREREERRAAEERRIAEERRVAEAQSRSRRKREERKDDGVRKLRKSEQRKSEAMRVESYISYAPHQMQASSSSSSSDSRPVERRPSMSTRPTSELPSAANLNALRAKEAWDMERLWKARSMYGAEWNNGAVGTQSMSSFQDDPAASQAVAYGSGHTAFLVQAPFQTPGSNIYHSMPNKPPPIIYGSPASIPSLPDSSYDPYDRNNIGHYQPPNGYSNGSPSKSLMATSTILSQSALLNNPLPEPPRESTYQPAPLPPLKPGNNRSESWVKYTSVTTAH